VGSRGHGKSRAEPTTAIALSAAVDTSFDDAVTDDRKALAHHVFGVLSEIDVEATLKVGLGQHMEDHLIRGRWPTSREPGPGALADAVTGLLQEALPEVSGAHRDGAGNVERVARPRRQRLVSRTCSVLP